MQFNWEFLTGEIKFKRGVPGTPLIPGGKLGQKRMTSVDVIVSNPPLTPARDFCGIRVSGTITKIGGGRGWQVQQWGLSWKGQQA